MKPKWHKEDDGRETLSASEDSPPYGHVTMIDRGHWRFEAFMFDGHRVSGLSKTRNAAKAWVKAYLAVEEKIKQQKAVMS